ncbi:e3 ubiquitin-protein ligase TRIP12 [Trichonephila inaurata madagascariensis]|uniref:E3 ubiquitin-protein ligase n=1 Tax=Trichonephila inaurata madagascariensis TaxID=2747483 RepID=A0A8X7CU78_9ARAC|nr:e3 ubiquitin-protein ligase TRIP12 [Trichonephila inaurata madagascariensis]
MAAQCTSGKESVKRLLRSQDESSKHSRNQNSTSSETKVSKKQRKSAGSIPQTITRSPIITRSRSKSLGLLQSVNLVNSSMDNSSQTPVEDSLKRKYSLNSERKTGESSKESVAKKVKSCPTVKKAKIIIMSNTSINSKNELNNVSEASSGRCDSTDVSNSKMQASDPRAESSDDVPDSVESGLKSSASSSSSSDNSGSGMLERNLISNDKLNNLNLDDNSLLIPPVEDLFFSCSRLSQAENTPQQLSNFPYNENEMSNEARNQKYEILKTLSDRKLITKSDFQKSLLSAMQRTRNSQNNSKSSDNQMESRPGSSSMSDFQNVLRIKLEKDDETTKEQCKFSKTSNLRDINSTQQPFFKSPASSSSGAQSSAYHNISVKQEMDLPSGDELPNPFLTRRIFIPDTMDSESAAQGINSANNSAAVGNSESIDGEIGRLQALMDSRRIPLSLFGALESRMQQLFHKSMGTATSGRAQQLLQELQAAEDDEHQLQVLIEISQLLVMGNEDTLIGFPVKQIIPILINLLLKEYNFELMNQACRALTYLIEALPRSSSVIVEAIPVLLNKVQVIQCIDVAEQALTALKMLSKWHSKAILQARGVSACLMHLDFFSINAQRTALAIIANCCQNILPQEFSLVQDSLPILSGWLTHQDEKSVESICLVFSGLVDCFQHDSDCLMKIGSNELLTNIQQLLVVSPPIISSQIFTTVVHMLAVMCVACSEIVVFLLKQDFAETLQYLLTESCDNSKEIQLTPRSPHEYLELSSLICEILPSIPPNDLFSVNALIVAVKRKISPPNSVLWQWKDDTGYWHSHDKNDSKNIEEAFQRGNTRLIIADRVTLSIDLQRMEQFDEGTSTSRQIRRHIITPEDQCKKTRTEIFEKHEDLVISSIKILFPVLFEIYCSSAGTTVKHKCLRAMLRMIYFAPPEVLHQVLKQQSISRHIASMLATQDIRTVIPALQIAEILMQKLPSDFRVHFIREGVLHEIRVLAKFDPKTWQIETISEASTSFSPDSSHMHLLDYIGDVQQIPKSDAGQSTSSMPVISSTQGSSSLAKDDESNSTNVASKIRDALKRRYMTIKRTFGSSDKDGSSLCGSDFAISIDNRIKINSWIIEQAQSFDDKYFNIDQISSHPVINVLNILTKAVQGLECMDNNGLRSLVEIRDVVTQNDISSFELIHSGLVKKLELFLSAPQGESLPFGNKPLEDRLRTFLHVFVGSPPLVTPEINPENFDASPLVNLITKLNACVSHLEQFPVKVYDQPTNGNTGRPGANLMKFFNMHQLKCLFQRHPSCTTLRQWHSGPVMIDPLASVHNVDRYLINQGFGSLRDDDESESDLSYDDSSDEDGGLIVADIRMDHGHGSPKLQFLIGKNVLPYNMTLYQAVRQYGNGDSQNSSSAQHLDCDYPVGYASVWLKTHTIWYRPIPPEDSEGASSNSTNTSQTSSGKKKSSSSRCSHSTKNTSERTRASKNKKDAVWDYGIVPKVAFPSSFVAKLAGFESIKDPSLEVIILLRDIHSLSSHWGLLYELNSWSLLIPQATFINNELTLKVNRQLHDPLAIMTANTPTWLSHIAYNFPFLFPFETRHLLFYVTSFDRERALQRLIDTVPELTNTEKISPRLEKRKRTVSRNSLLKQAEAILQDHGDSKALLEIQYKNEVGTGLGPTLEFYALVSKELQRTDLDMWHAVEVVTEEEKEPPMSYVHSPSGLFPMPVSRNARTSSLTKVCNKFKLLGKFLAKAIMDSRLVDIPLSLAFFKWMLNQEKYLSLGDLQHIDESLAHNISKLEKIIIEKKKLENDSSMNATEMNRSLESITLDGCSIKDLSLDFTLPGYSRIELKKGGKDISVNIHNLEDYLKLLKYWTMSEGVSKQMRAFKEGFESVLSLNRLQVFYPEELAYLFCGNVHNQWDIKSLTDSCRPDHGYTYESQAIKFLFEVLCKYNPTQQRQFIQFITGSPRLPIGGLKSLSPPLTIVRKTSDDDDNSDSYLPSVMTCVNYLKLPDYSSIEIMQEKLQTAINEGQHSFHLS